MAAFRGVRLEWRWPVVASAEPAGVRTIRGYVVVVMERPNYAETAPIDSAWRVPAADSTWAVSFLDSEERSIYAFESDEFWVFAGAAARALSALGLAPGAVGPAEPAGDIVR